VGIGESGRGGEKVGIGSGHLGGGLAGGGNPRDIYLKTREGQETTVTVRSQSRGPYRVSPLVGSLAMFRTTHQAHPRRWAQGHFTRPARWVRHILRFLMKGDLAVNSEASIMTLSISRIYRLSLRRRCS
jgi:hypothetical protein